MNDVLVSVALLLVPRSLPPGRRKEVNPSGNDAASLSLSLE